VKKAVFVFLLALLLLPGEVAVGRSLNARPNYVRLNEWARANVFSVRWLERDRTIELTREGTRLTFNVDSRSDARKAQIDGTQVWLAFPVLNQNGSVLISQTDLAETIAPVLAPRANPPGIKVKTICLDPGHGGNDPGYQVGSNDEKKYTLLLAQETRAELKAAGFNVVLTRTTDVKIPLEDRSAFARKKGADMFISLHFNASETARNEVKGTEIFCCTPAGATSTNARGEGDTRWVVGNRHDERNMLLAYELQKSYANDLRVEDRGVKRARFEVLRESTVPSILIEGGFLSHPTEGKKITDPAYRKQMAHAIVQGVLAYKKAIRG
jgi:N-acetylmuramoyl-L-alanine amidase